jgi:hypothetical protein
MADPIDALHEYYRAFSTLSIDAVLPYFEEPAMLIGPQGPFAATTHDLLAMAIGPAMEALRSRGFGRSELIVSEVKRLGAAITVVMGVAQRYKVDGEALEQAGVTYVMHLGQSGWKIAVLMLHDVG